MNLDGVDATKMTNLKEIEEIAFEKRQQWQSAATMQIESLQQALNIKCKLLDELQSKFSQLKIDFKYNLKVHNTYNGNCCYKRILLHSTCLQHPSYFLVMSLNSNPNLV